jgi:protoporphyrin/coproporphyrin ferrochelatase
LSFEPSRITTVPHPYDALLVVSFGGPEGPDQVMPFLENVLRGRNVPRERMLAVAEHYQHFGGVSPINAQNRALIAALREELRGHGIDLPIYWGNRNWQPLLPDTLREMAQHGVRRALAFFTSIFSSYSGCRQYRENIAAAQEIVGPAAPQVDKIRAFFNHPGFIAAMADRVSESLARFGDERSKAKILFTAHSIPASMAANCRYETQLRESSRLVAEAVDNGNWRLVYQSRSGPPSQPWLEPDVGVALRELAAERTRNVVVAPIGFISDHMEVMYDLDEEARAIANELGLHMERAGTVGVHPRFVQMIRELIVERMSDNPQRLAIGNLPPSHDVCPVDCCLK